MEPDSPPQLNDRQPLPQLASIAIVIICAIGAAIRLWGLTERSLWLDELFSSLYAQISWGEIIEMRKQGTNPPLFHFLLSIWVSIFEGSGQAAENDLAFRTISAFTLRSFAAVPGVVSIWAIFRLGKAVFDIRTGLIAALFLCFSHMAIAYSMEARFYALNELLAICSTWSVYSWGTSRKRSAGIIWLILMIAFVWTHTFGWFVLTAHGLWLLWLIVRAKEKAEKRRRFFELCVGMGIIVISFLPWVPVLHQQITRVSGGYWIKKPRGYELFHCLYDYLLPVRHLSTLLFIVSLGLAVFYLVRAIARRPSTEQSDPVKHHVPQDRKDAYVLLGCAALVPFLIPWGWSLVGTPIFQVKYTIVGQPMVLLLFAYWMRWRPTIPLVLIAILCMWTHKWFYDGYPLVHEHWKETAAMIQQNEEEEPIIYLCHDYCWFPMVQYYEQREHIIPVLPPDEEVTDFVEYYTNPYLPFSDFASEVSQQNREVWIVFSHFRSVDGQELFDETVKKLTADRIILEEQIWGDMAIFYLSTPDGNS